MFFEPIENREEIEVRERKQKRTHEGKKRKHRKYEIKNQNIIEQKDYKQKTQEKDINNTLKKNGKTKIKVDEK